jgi:type VI secretion system secreted protein VgrG
MTRIEHVQYTFECDAIDWRVRTLVLQESLGEPFRAELRMVATTRASLAQLLGRAATLTMTRGDHQRVFRGEITRAELAGGAEESWARVRFEPVISRLARERHSRIFQGMSTLEIVHEIVGVVPGLEYDVGALEAMPPREYCVQYQEPDLGFVQRLLEDEGVAWYLDDRGDHQVMRVVDRNASFDAIDEVGELRVEPDAADVADDETVQWLVLGHRSRSAGVVERDWEWLDGASVIERRYPEDAPAPQHEVHQLRRNAVDTSDASVRREYERRACCDTLGRGGSNATSLAAGRRVGIAYHGGEPVDVLVTSVRHTADCPEQERGRTRAGANYANTFECQPLQVPYRPQRSAPRPRIDGLHTAVVTGPAGEEIHTDEHGRICVRMHWDRSDSAPELASCWLRVAQSSAGSGWGAVFIPRVGMEVLVAFLDGDPDRPLCIGSVYNATHRPPYPLPDDRTKTTIRTQSSPGGDGHNELTFEDAAGHEEVYLRAQRNLREVVLANHSEQVGVDDTASIGRDRKTTIDRHETHSVGGDRFREVVGSEAVQISGSQHVVVFGGPAAGPDVPTPTPPGADMFVHGSYTLDVRDQITVRCGPSVITLSPLGITVVGPMLSLDGGGSTFALVPGAATLQSDVVGVATAGGSELHMADAVRVGSGASIKLQVDQSRLTLDGTARLRGPTTLIEGTSQLELVSDTAATIAAPSIDISADESATISSVATLELSGLSITSKATGPHVIKGATINLNPPGGA